MTMLLPLLLALSAAAETPAADTTLPTLPPAPERSPDHDGDCTAKAAAPAGVPRDCDAVSVPPSYLAHLESTRVYAGQLRLHLTAAQSVAAADARSCADGIEWRDQVISDLREPRPFLQRPGVQAGLGIAGGVLLTVSAAWALGQVAP